MSKAGTQILTLEGLRFDANLGILDHEKSSPQPIQVDAELNLGTQPPLPTTTTSPTCWTTARCAHHHRGVHSGHVNLLESLIGKLAHRPDAAARRAGRRVRIVKLEICDDCEVAIRVETGLWWEGLRAGRAG